MLLILLIIIVLLLFGGGGFYGRKAGWGPRGFGGLLATVLILVLLIWAVKRTDHAAATDAGGRAIDHSVSELP